ncbi:chromosome partitioning protein, ParB family [Caloramator fervidus]|uniref:Chromosome partitioning protein, ParB family n=1 Tax=Caloramator fervidus TaxID=29344 RepID=A0A1H5WG52_9CLOT|nr:nucleoid occlusion protein [Caloramator fervidus]SEF98246.1 chromosome partitioning protein, ParB family [Caloramator fervidus]
MRVENEIKIIPINLIKQNSYQPRKVFDDQALLELSESIREYGVLQPISVRKINDSFYELIAGERRLRASQLAGLTEIPAVVVEASDRDSAVLALIENLQREDLNFIEEAEGYLRLIKEHGFTQEELAHKIGKKQSTIANKLRILKLSDTVKEILLKENLTERHARALLKLPTEEMQLKALDEIIKNGLNVKETEELIEKMLNGENTKKQKKQKEEKEKPKYKWVINPKIITNTIKDIMSRNGIEAEYKHKEYDDYMEIIVRIKK